MDETVKKTLVVCASASFFGVGAYSVYDYSARLSSDKIVSVMEAKKAAEEKILSSVKPNVQAPEMAPEQAVDPKAVPQQPSLMLKNGTGWGITIPLSK